jgi:small subunit ribosomal protein S17
MQEDQNTETVNPATNPAGEQTQPTVGTADVAAARQGGGRKTRQGLVVSNKMNKSIVVAVVRRVRHPLYKKYFNKTKKYMAHDETNDCNVGDTVRIVETRPVSARKRWRVDAIVERAK